MDTEKDFQKALEESNTRYQKMVANIPGLVYQFFTSPDGFISFSFVSEISREMFNLNPEDIKRNANLLLDHIHLEDRESFYHCINESAKTLSPCIWEGRILVNGDTKWFRSVARPERQLGGNVLWDGLIMDITPWKKLEDSQRLAQLGEIAAGIAHEVNNPLQIIFARAQLSLMPNIQEEGKKKNLEIIKDQCSRANDIIQRLLIFARPSKGNPKEVNINDSIDFVVNLIEQYFKYSNVRIIKKYDLSLPLVKIAELEMQEVFMNLLRNAADAMPEGGTITITTLKEKNNVRIDFTDTGIGMSESDLKKIFDPFFTTKEKGTGLGLSVCFGIVKSHGGQLKYTSKPGSGTTATVLLPI